jgi:hypothetical protein
MCEFLSGVITRQNHPGGEGRLYFGSLTSHSGIEKEFGLRPDTYREFEWTGNAERGLTVLVAKGESEQYYRAMILADYPTRDALVEAILAGKHGFNRDRTSLNWSNAKLTDDDLPTMQRILDALPQVETVDCAHNQLTHLPDMPQVETVDCAYNQLTDEQIQAAQRRNAARMS